MKKDYMKVISCPRCNYQWATMSNHVYVSCPSCLTKVHIKKNEVNGIDNQKQEKQTLHNKEWKNMRDCIE